MGGGDFFGDVYAKMNIADVLRRELPRFSREPVNLGGITDSYQPAERDCKLMPRVLSLLADFSVPIILCTKSALVLRDLELISRVNAASGASLAFTVTTLNKRVADLIEPGSSRPHERIAAIREVKKTGASCGVHLMPIIPYLTSSEESMEAVFSEAKEAGADYVLTGALNLKSATRKQFFESVKKGFPSEYADLQSLFNDKAAYRAYKEKLYATVNRLREKYAMPSYIMPKQRQEPTQLTFF
jgi:DNA repair photolyase